MQIQVISKTDGNNQLIKEYLEAIQLKNESVILVDVKVEDIEKIEYLDNKAIITLKNGEQILIDNFNVEESSLVFRNENSELFLFDFETISYNPIDKIEPLLYGHSSSSFISIWPIAGLVLGGIGLVAGAAGGSGSSSNQAENIPIIDKDKPKVEINVNTNGIITIKPNEPVYKADDKDKTNPIDTVDEWKDLIEVENGTVSIDDKGNLVVKPTNPTQDVVVTLPKDTVKDEAGNGNDKAEGKLPSTGNVELSVPTVVATITVITDNRATLKVVSDRGITGDNTPVVAGTATANSQVNVYANGVLVGQTTADNKGKWSLELPKQADGDVTIEAAEANAAGEGPKSAEIVITIDTKAPDAPTGIEIETTTTTDDEDNEIVDQTVTGKASPEEAGSTVVVKDKDGTVIAEGKVDAEGNFAVEIPTDRLIPEGGKVDVIVVDKAENSSKPTEVVRGDETGPVLETAEVNGEGQIILSFNEALDANDPAKLDSFTVTVGKDDNQATVKVLDIDVIGNQVVLTTEPPIYAGQEYKVDYKDKDLTDANAIQDRSGNDAADFSTADLADGKVSNGSTQNPNPDLPTNQPTITGLYDNRVLNEESEIKADEGEPLITGDNTPVVAGTATANSQVNVYANGVLVGQTTADNKGKWSLELPKQADGDVTIEAAEANAAGEGPRSEAKEITVDTVAPKVVSASTDVEGQILITFDKKLSTDLPLAENFTVIVDGKVVKVKDSGISLDESKHNLTLELTSPILKGEDVQVIYLDPTTEDDQYAIQNQVGVDNLGFAIVVDTTNAVLPLKANNDFNIINFELENIEPWPDVIVANNTVVLGLLDSYTESLGVEFQVNDRSDSTVLADALITIKQSDLLSVATGFKVVILRENEQGQYEEYAIKTVQNGGVVADSSLLQVLGVVGDGDTIAVNLEDLPAGNYKAVVAKDQSVLSDVLTKLTLAQLGSGEKLLGADNEALILETLEAVLTAEGKANLLSTVVVGTVSGLLDVVNGLRLDVLLNALTELPLVGDVLDLADFTTTLVSKLVQSTLSVYEQTDISLYGKDKYFDSLVTDGVNSLIDGDGADLLGYGNNGKVIAIQTVDAQGNVSEAISLQFENYLSQPIKGLYGELTIKENGEYVYKAYGNHNALGQYEKFIYTLHDGYNPDSKAELLIEITGVRHTPQDLSNSPLYASSDYVQGLLNPPTIIPDSSSFKTDGSLLVNGGKYIEAKTGFITVGLDLGPVIDLGLIESNSDADKKNVGIRFTVENGHVQELTAQADAGGVIAGTVDLFVYKLNTKTGFYELSQTIKDWYGGLLVAISQPTQLTFTEGDYVLVASAGRGLTAATGYTLYVTDKQDYDYTSTAGVTFMDGSYQLTGNLFTDKSGMGEDRLTTNAKLYAVNGIKFGNEQTLEVNTKYGKLIVNKDGSYTYQLSDTASGYIGQKESVSYTVYDSQLGISSTANLEINFTTVDSESVKDSVKIKSQIIVQKDIELTIFNDKNKSVNMGDNNTPSAGDVYTYNFSIDPNVEVQDLKLILNAHRVYASSSDVEGSITFTIYDKATGQSIVGPLSYMVPSHLTDNTLSNSSITLPKFEAGNYQIIFEAKGGVGGLLNGDIAQLNWDATLKATTSTHLPQVVQKEIVEEGDLFDTNFINNAKHERISIAGKEMFIKDVLQQYDSIKVKGQYGELTLYHNGHYSYKTTGNGYGVDEFSYSLLGPDGSYDQAVLSINVGAELVGSVYADTLKSTAGNDLITTGTGADTLIYKLLDATSSNGGNGVDTWTDFEVGNTGDKINVSALLEGSQTDGNISQYLSVRVNDNNVTLVIDRDGDADKYEATELLTLQGTSVQNALTVVVPEGQKLEDLLLQQLLNNNQIIY